MNPLAELRAAHYYPDAGLPGWRVDAFSSWSFERDDISMVVSEETSPEGIRVWSWLSCRIVEGEAHPIANGEAAWPRAAMHAAAGSVSPGLDELYRRFAGGETVRSLANEAGIRTPTLYGRLQRYAERQGEQWPVRRENRRTRHNPSRAPRAIQLRQQGLRWKVIAERVGYSCYRSAQRSIRGYCDRNGLEYPRAGSV